MFPLNEVEYKHLVRDMPEVHSISSTFGRRRAMEQTYFLHHKSRGVKLRAKYRGL